MAYDYNQREYDIRHAELPPIDPNFVHVEPSNKPVRPVFRAADGGTLTAPEEAQVEQWLNDRIDASVTLPNAVTMRDSIIAFEIALKAWRVQDRAARQAQWRNFAADTLAENEAVVPPTQSSDGETGTGTPAWPAVVNPD